MIVGITFRYYLFLNLSVASILFPGKPNGNIAGRFLKQLDKKYLTNQDNFSSHLSSVSGVTVTA